MPIITLFGASFGDDEEIARRLAAKLNYPLVGREILVAASERCGVPEAKLNDIFEREPHWWERWQENLQPYRIALRAALSQAALNDDLVYHGHVGHGLLPGIRHVLRVLLTAPMEYRVDQVVQRRQMKTQEARRYIEQVEKARTRRLLALFGTDWRDVDQYALVLNRAQLSLAAAENLLVHAAKQMDYQPTEESRQALQDLALTAKVESTLLTHPLLGEVEISVQARHGEVTLSGILPQSGVGHELRNLVKAIPGVNKVLVNLVTPGSALRRHG